MLPRVWTILHCFPKPQAGGWMEVGSLVHELVRKCDPGTCKDLATGLPCWALKYHFWKVDSWWCSKSLKWKREPGSSLEVRVAVSHTQVLGFDSRLRLWLLIPVSHQCDPKNQQLMDQVTRLLSPRKETWLEFWAPRFSLAYPWTLQAFEQWIQEDRSTLSL